METFEKGIEILGNITVVAGIVILIFGIIQLFTSLGSQNSDSKNHSGYVIAAGIGVTVAGKVLIPMISGEVVWS
mgnify:CR=1 FL=1